MKRFIVLYRDATLRPCDVPYGFACQADNADHAEGQCADAEPGAEVVWIAQCDTLDAALRDYWGPL